MSAEEIEELFDEEFENVRIMEEAAKKAIEQYKLEIIKVEARLVECSSRRNMLESMQERFKSE